MREADASSVLTIYAEGIATGHATFQAEVPDWSTWSASHLASCRIVAEEAGAVLGWAALSPVSTRAVYAGVAEISIYIGEDARGRGVGRVLLEALQRSAETAGIWMLQAGIFPENEASIALHRKLGFRILGRRERIGKMGYGPLRDQWRDVALLEWRSPNVGNN